MKKRIGVLLFALMLFATPAMAQDITLQINGQTVQPAVAPMLEDGTTLVPIRVVSENLGASVDWNSEERSITITKDASTMRLVLEQKAVTVNGQVSELTVAPRSIDGTTIVPIRFVSQNLDCTVEWDSDTQTVKIAGNGEAQPPAPAPVQTTPEPAATVQKPAASAPQYSGGHQVISDEDYVVYVTKTGEKYHEGSCSSLRKSKIQTTLGKATDAYYDACDKCNPPILDI